MSENAARTLETSSSEILWFVARGSVLKGPFTSTQLEERIKKKDISYLDYCWRQGFREWRPIAAVEDLDRRRRMTRVPTYPTVEVPQGGRPGPVAVPAASVEPQAPGAPREVRINFSKVRNRKLSLYEWALAVVLAVILAHLSTAFALRSVEESLLHHFQFHRLSATGTLGTPEASLPVDVWAPLASAPGLQDVNDAGFLEMPVSFVAPLVADTKEGMRYGAHRVSYGVPSVVEAEREGLDPVLVQSFEVHGRLSPLDFHNVQVEARGEPWIRQK